MTSQITEEPILERDLAIVDAHHHLWFQPTAAIAAMEGADSVTARALAITFRRHQRYLFDEFMADLQSGHNIRATVYNDAHAMYRAGGPEPMKSVGEVEFVNGVAAMGASGLFGEINVCAGIVGGANLQLGDAVEEILVAHIRAGGGRYRGVRSPSAYDEDPTIFGSGTPHVLLGAKFRAGFGRLQPLGLSCDILVLEPQLPELIDLARAFPETQIILNHVGSPLGVGRYADTREERFPLWRDNMRTLAKCFNVSVKLGGFGNPFWGFKSHMAAVPFSSADLAEEWKPYVLTCIEAFGADRCMFESNFPVDSSVGSYATVWNAFKRIAAGASDNEKRQLFMDTATKVYRLNY